MLVLTYATIARCLSFVNAWHSFAMLSGCLCHYNVACPHVTYGGDGLQMQKVGVNVLNGQSETASWG